MKKITNRILILIVLIFAITIECIYFANMMFNMPGERFRKPIPQLTKNEENIRLYLKAVIHILAEEKGIRCIEINRTNVWTAGQFRPAKKHHEANMNEAADYIESDFFPPAWIEGIGFSDQWSFWQEGYPAIMITDTGPNRYKAYHTRQDTPDKIKYDKMKHVVVGIGHIIAERIGCKEDPWKHFRNTNIE